MHDMLVNGNIPFQLQVTSSVFKRQASAEELPSLPVDAGLFLLQDGRPTYDAKRKMVGGLADGALLSDSGIQFLSAERSSACSWQHLLDSAISGSRTDTDIFPVRSCIEQATPQSG
ncbi:hypothetical protein RvY_06951-2 [Ramazzottius varieornatus]|uniref:Uncharacterized protein n=1 Tax=Ramazzottius varieornatus TaxID=947166 RepID=A0A1D1V3N6_RAMVA|nr:hypothetical protein RvY_06951-2 [Ramazzottius varieornatus]